VCELIMQAQDTWEAALAPYTKLRTGLWW
jgi:hypothetical protein